MACICPNGLPPPPTRRGSRGVRCRVGASQVESALQSLPLPTSGVPGPACLHCLFSALPPGLKTPSGCELVVGGEPQCWAEGRCLLFDDSFLHAAFHEGECLCAPWPPLKIYIYIYLHVYLNFLFRAVSGFQKN